MNIIMPMKMATVPSDTMLQGGAGRAGLAAQGCRVEEVVEGSPTHQRANPFWQVSPPPPSSVTFCSALGALLPPLLLELGEPLQYPPPLRNAHLSPWLLEKARLPQPGKKPGSRVNQRMTRRTKRKVTAISAKVMGPSRLCSVWMTRRAACC